MSAINQNAILQKHLRGIRPGTISRPTPGIIRAAMTKEEERELREELARLQQLHRDLDAAIAALQDFAGRRYYPSAAAEKA